MTPIAYIILTVIAIFPFRNLVCGANLADIPKEILYEYFGTQEQARISQTNRKFKSYFDHLNPHHEINNDLDLNCGKYAVEIRRYLFFSEPARSLPIKIVRVRSKTRPNGINHNCWLAILKFAGHFNVFRKNLDPIPVQLYIEQDPIGPVLRKYFGNKFSQFSVPIALDIHLKRLSEDDVQSVVELSQKKEISIDRLALECEGLRDSQIVNLIAIPSIRDLDLRSMSKNTFAHSVAPAIDQRIRSLSISLQFRAYDSHRVAILEKILQSNVNITELGWYLWNDLEEERALFNLYKKFKYRLRGLRLQAYGARIEGLFSDILTDGATCELTILKIEIITFAHLCSDFRANVFSKIKGLIAHCANSLEKVELSGEIDDLELADVLEPLETTRNLKKLVLNPSAIRESDFSKLGGRIQRIQSVKVVELVHAEFVYMRDAFQKRVNSDRANPIHITFPDSTTFSDLWFHTR